MPKRLLKVITQRKQTYCYNTFSGQSKLREPGKVFARLQELAKTGDREAENNLGLCFEFGYGTAQDFREAAVWYLRAAKGGLGTALVQSGRLLF
jgi:TPR repeat protein